MRIKTAGGVEIEIDEDEADHVRSFMRAIANVVMAAGGRVVVSRAQAEEMAHFTLEAEIDAEGNQVFTVRARP